MTIVALGLTIGMHAFTMAVQQWELGILRDVRSGTHIAHETVGLIAALARIGVLGHAVLLLVTGVLFIRWLRIVVKLTRALGGGLKWTTSDAVWSFFFPLLNLLQPYWLLRDIGSALAPDRVPDPRPTIQADGTAGYREVRVVAPPPATKLPAASIAAWWASYVLGTLLISAERLYSDDSFETRLTERTVSDTVRIASAVLAFLVVRSITARLVERLRRVSHNPAEVLRAAGITIS